jgi:hypothetical protein
MFYKWILKKVTGGVAKYPRASLGIVIGYVALSWLEVIPVVEVLSDFAVVAGYVLIKLHIAKKRSAGKSI